MLRGLTASDIPAWAGLLRAIEDEDRTGVVDNEASLTETLTRPRVDPAHDLIGAFAGEELVGHGWVFPRTPARGILQIEAGGGVRPDHRGAGLGSRLVEAVLARARVSHAEVAPETTAHVEFSGLAGQRDQAELLSGHGLAAHKWSFRMRRPLDPVPDVIALPSGFRVSELDPRADADRILAAHNVVFLDHPGFSGWSAEEWEVYAIAARASRHQVSFVVDDTDGNLVGYLMTTESDAHTESTGRREAYVQRMGVRREHRGRGIAAALLAHALEAYRKAGYDDASLDVLADNPTGALGVYQRVGFEAVSRWTGYRVVVPPVA